MNPRLADAQRRHLLSMATLEKVQEALLVIALAHFNEGGIDGCSLDVVLGGWQAFGSHCFLFPILARLMSE